MKIVKKTTRIPSEYRVGVTSVIVQFGQQEFNK